LLLFQQPDNTHGISRPQSIIVATNEWSLLADALEGVSAGAVKWCPFTARQRLRRGSAIVC
jgi:hypothetical protein